MIFYSNGRKHRCERHSEVTFEKSVDKKLNITEESTALTPVKETATRADSY